MISLLMLLLLKAPDSAPAANREASERMEKKIAGILERSTLPAGQRGGPVTVTLEEIESFFALSKVPKIPEGVSGIRFESHPREQAVQGIVEFCKYRESSSERPMDSLVE